MKKAVLLITVLLSSVCIAQAQDLIVTKSLDTINCKLGKLKGDFYPITFIYYDTMMYGTIHKDSILVFRKSLFRGLSDNTLRPWYSYLDFDIDVGAVYQTGKFRMEHDLFIDKDGNDIHKSEFNTRRGYFAGAELNYFVSKRIGYGLKYNYRWLLDGNLTYQYVGPALIFRFLERKRVNYATLNFSAGYAWMIQKDAPLTQILRRLRIEMHAQTLAGHVGVGYTHRFSKRLSGNVKLSYFIAYPNFLTIKDIRKINPTGSEKPLETGDYCNNMNTINLTFGITVHK